MVGTNTLLGRAHDASHFPTLTTRPPRPTLFPYTTLFRSRVARLTCECGGRCARRANRWSVKRTEPIATTIITARSPRGGTGRRWAVRRSEEHTSELQSRRDLVCRLLLEKKKLSDGWNQHLARTSA